MAAPILIIDLGTSTIKAIVAEPTAEGWRIVHSGERPARGIKRGVIKRMDDVAEEVDSLITEIEGVINKGSFKDAIVGVNGPHLSMAYSQGMVVVARPDAEITNDDKERADEAAIALAPQENQVLVQRIIKDYVIDQNIHVDDPVGLKGHRLQSNVILINALSPAIRQIDRLGDIIKIRFHHDFVLPLAGAEVALTSRDKEEGVIALDLGASTTSLSVFRDSQLVDFYVFRQGSSDITNDIARVLQLPIEVAEKLKVQEGTCLPSKIKKDKDIDLDPYLNEDYEGDGSQGKTTINRKTLAQIIEARQAETFDFVVKRLKELDLFGKLPGGVVLYGGGANLKGIKTLAKNKFKLSVRIARPKNEWYADNPNPCYVNVLGLLDLVKDEQTNNIVNWPSSLSGKNLLDYLKRIFSF